MVGTTYFPEGSDWCCEEKIDQSDRKWRIGLGPKREDSKTEAARFGHIPGIRVTWYNALGVDR
jgi:hypothetical protein